MRCLFLLLCVASVYGEEWKAQTLSGGDETVEGLARGSNGDWCRSITQIVQQANLTGGGLTWSRPCESARAPQSVALSGQGCYAMLAHTGWYRAAAINPVLNVVVMAYDSPAVLAISTSSTGGANMFMARYVFLANYGGGEAKMTFPCYLLNVRYREVCVFHSGFGRLAGPCATEVFNVVNLAVNLVYGSLIAQYGGPMGVAYVYSFTYFSFLSNLPLSREENEFSNFASSYIMWNPEFNSPSNWAMQITRVSPLEASDGFQGFNYGYSSYLSRGYFAFENGCGGRGWCTDHSYYSNSTIAVLVSVSANTQSGMAMAPFSFAAMDWGSGANNAAGTGIKVYGMVLSYMSIRGMIVSHRIQADGKAPNCKPSCPTFDGTFADSGGATGILQAASQQSQGKAKPRSITLIGSSDSFAMMKVYLGVGGQPMASLPSGCPLLGAHTAAQPSACRFFDLAKKFMAGAAGTALDDLDAEFDIVRPQTQVLSAFCADPIAYDQLQGSCEANAYCSLSATVVPGTSNRIGYFPEEYVVSVAIVYLGVTPHSKLFVKTYIPARMLRFEFYTNMADWFPNFHSYASASGSVGFTNNAGNALMDYTTFLSMRLVGALLQSQSQASQLHYGRYPTCPYQAARATFDQTLYPGN